MSEVGPIQPSRRSVLRNGFTVFIVLLGVSTTLAYYIQDNYSRRTVEIHRQYAQQQDLLTNLRRVLSTAAISTRDYFINPAVDKHEAYYKEIEQLRSEASRLVAELKHRGSVAETTPIVRDLEFEFSDLWPTLKRPYDSTWDEDTRYRFLQEEVSPRRDAASRLLRKWETEIQNTMAETENRHTASRRTATFSLIGVLAASLIVGLIVSGISLRYSDQLERQAAEQFMAVSDAKQELERLSVRLMEIQEEERTRLSRELHDEVVQNLAVLKIEINRAISHTPTVSAELLNCLKQARRLSETTMHSVRDISLLLRPSILDDLGLGPALQFQTEDFSRRTGTHCEFEEQGLTDDLRGPLKTCVYRVTQEALRNCEKHSRATKVKVTVIQTEKDMTVEIADNGVGFSSKRNVPSTPLNLGVLGMRERAAAVGGSLNIKSAVNQGTTVKLCLPIHSAVMEGSHVEAHA